MRSIPYPGDGGAHAPIALPADSRAPAAARRLLIAHACAVPGELLDHAVLLVSELVSNAVRHGEPVITITVAATSGQLAVAVHDHGPAHPVLPTYPAGPAQLSGRGLRIVDAVATAWGIVADPHPPGKTVWFELTI